MKFGFVSCVELGLACMEEIYSTGGQLELVITLFDHMAPKKSGRVYVDNFCASHGIDLVKVQNINDKEAIKAIQSRDIDWLFIIGWSQIAKRDVLNAPLHGCLGMHPTLLPEGRGRAAIPWAIIKELHKTGVTLFKLDEGVDTGPILGQEVLLVSQFENATQLYKRVADAHRTLIARVWPDLVKDKVTLRKQDEKMATVWPERRPEDGEFNFGHKCETVDRLVRAVTHPYPGAFLQSEGTIYRIWQGEAHLDSYLDQNLEVDSLGHLWIRLSNGRYEAIQWERGSKFSL